MPDVSYGHQTIRYVVRDCPDSKAHYISVSHDEGVVLKGPQLPPPQADRMVLKKARWILDKLEIVRATESEAIVTGSRIAYLGKHYYTEVVFDPTIATAQIDFNHSRFKIHANPETSVQPAIADAFAHFFRVKATEKITPRVKQWAARTGLEYQDLKFRQMEKRWGSCTPTNTIILNVNLVKLPYSLIDYVIVHELCHTKVKNHTTEFWAELARHMSDWKSLDERMSLYRL